MSETQSSATLHFLCGKIASGKSTLAQQLVRGQQAVLLSEDTWLAALYPGQITQLADYIEKSRLLKSALELHLVTLLQKGITLVLDFPANTPEQRQWLKGLAEQAGCSYCCHVLDVSDEECKRRLAARNLSGENPFTTSAEQFDLITAHFSYPSEEEELVISGR
ncbi:ATP-binding protein [Morganella morganii subsp. morganii]|uniref:AAA family ATPase n=1 Tax=Morganella morganii TaxID=582 RepID=UPI0015F58FD5|nr:ATP-binding protein [Morganella morganii]ELA8472374.1 ATP-binding protein [Morganella morganii]MBA5852967.1 ATP-binding protein [Morganella morganii]MBT0446397.1 ATP-binding protein [Morganella morganii subsp. morganii]MBT0450425.1 ATP-binding protein [Morganella morganii subsp. morganii]MBT0508034.1 ATP-binding protein [Morganella morganii subsp. morganii]